MKVLSIDLGSYKAVVASSDGDVVLDPLESRSTRTIIDYRGKKRLFGTKMGSYKNINLVVENVQQEIADYGDILVSSDKNVEPKEPSALYAMISYLVRNYMKRAGVAAKEIELVVVLPTMYGEVLRRILVLLAEQTGVRASCIYDHQALLCYYLCRRTPAARKLLGIMDVGHEKTSFSLSLIEKNRIETVSHDFVYLGGRNVTEAVCEIMYRKVSTCPDRFELGEFKARNAKGANHVKTILHGLPSVKQTVEVNYDSSVEVTITQEEVMEEVFWRFEDVVSMLQRMAEEAAALKNMEGAEDMPIEIEITGASSRLFFVEKIVEDAFGVKPQVQIDDEAVALGGVYRKLMDSAHHRFLFDPVIFDVCNDMYSLKVESPEGETTTIEVFKGGVKSVKNTKESVVGVSYDPSIKLLTPPKKVVKVPNVRKATKITVMCNELPLYEMRLAEQRAPPAKDAEAGAGEEETSGDEHEGAGRSGENGAGNSSRKESAEKEAQNGNEQKSHERTVSIAMWIDHNGYVAFESKDVEATPLLRKISFSKVRELEEAARQSELEVERVEERLNAAQTRIFDLKKALSDKDTPLGHLRSANRISEMLSEYEFVPGDARTEKDAAAWEAKIESSIGPVVKAEWNEFASKVAHRVGKECEVALPLPAYPGVLGLLEVEERLRSVGKKKKLEEEEKRKREEKERICKEAQEAADKAEKEQKAKG